MQLRHLPYLGINYLSSRIGTRLVNAHTRTKVSKILEILEDDIDLRSRLRFLVPALFGNLPDRRGDSWGIKVARFWWSFALRDHNRDTGVRLFRKGHPSGHELEMETIRTWTCHTLGNQTHLHNDHRQRVHIGLIRRFFLLDPRDPSDVEKFGGAVTDGAAVVGG